jgi:hypothetical protein
MQTIHFNTRRLYTREGQQITATLHDDGVVTFKDHSRGISGEFIFTCGELRPRDVMSVYDYNSFKNSSRSWQDAFVRGGCNCEFDKSKEVMYV